MSREVHVPFYERLGVQFPRPTHRFGVSFRDVEDLLAQRAITVSYEAIPYCPRTRSTPVRRADSTLDARRVATVVTAESLC